MIVGIVRRAVSDPPVTHPDRVQADIDRTRAACAAALDEADAMPDLPIAEPARPHASDPDDSVTTSIARVREYSRSLDTARAALADVPDVDSRRAASVRRDLLRAAIASLARLASLPIAPIIMRRACEVFQGFCDQPRDPRDPRFRPDLDFHGCALAGCATLTRFPAGQLDWEVSGLPRSYLLRLPFWDVPRVAWAVLRQLRGLRPCFTAHMGVRRYPLLFVEAENHRAYHRMAQSMALQPEVRGLLMAAWFHSPETIRVSPHLAWTNRTPLAHGAILTDLGPASPDDGFLTGSPDRQRLFEAGAYRPTVGLIIWPRQALLAWAAAHPEFGVEADTD
jgi:hypothetical protein